MLQLVVYCTHDVAGRWQAKSWVHYIPSCNTQSNALDDGQNNCPKHVELTGITLFNTQNVMETRLAKLY